VSNQSTVLLISWILPTLIVSNGYKGKLFSFLTIQTIPEVPKDLDDLISSRFRKQML